MASTQRQYRRHAKAFLNNSRARFLFTLARDLCITIREVDEKITPQEFNMWVAFYEVDSMMQNEMSKGSKPQEALEKTKAVEDIREVARIQRQCK